MSSSKDFSTERKILYYVGFIVIVIGLFLFLSTFVSLWLGIGGLKSMGDQYANPNNSFFPRIGAIERAIIGFVMIFFGKIMQLIGRKGIAGSGLILNVDKEIKDLKPISTIIGGQINDALEETNIKEKLFTKEKEIKIRCLKCRYLNDESDNYCGGCGKEI